MAMNPLHLFLVCVIVCLSIGKADDPPEVAQTSDSDVKNSDSDTKHSNEGSKRGGKLLNYLRMGAKKLFMKRKQKVMESESAPEKCSSEEPHVKKHDVEKMLEVAQKDKDTGQKPKKIGAKLNTKPPEQAEENLDVQKPEQTGSRQREVGFKSQRGFNVHGAVPEDTKITSIAYLCQVWETQ